MIVTDQHKALLLTLLFSGTVLLTLFNFHIKQHDDIIAESYYDLNPEEPLTLEEIKQIEAIFGQKAETNKAFNETEKQTRFSKAYELIAPPEDYVKPELNGANSTQHLAVNSQLIKAQNPINKEDFESFDKINNVLEQQQEDVSNAKSTMSFSLSNRTSRFLPTPIYLCEHGGKIVVNITVDSDGNVSEAYVNSTSTSQNQCLIDHALEYAKEALFSSDTSKPSQLGSITFLFLGKQ